MQRNRLAFILFLVIAGGAVGSQLLFKWSKGTLLNPAPGINITVAFSSELAEWLQPATNAFNSSKFEVRNSQSEMAQVHVAIEAVDDGEALRDIATGKRSPTAWIPASTVWVNLLNKVWRTTHEADLLLRSGEYAATSLVRTPLVFVMDSERANSFLKVRKQVDWTEIRDAVTDPGGWKSSGGEDFWGNVKYSQPNPKSSNAGLLAVTLATYSYLRATNAISQTSILSTDKLDDTGYREWIEGLARSLPDSPPQTARQQIEDMLLYGTSKEDIVCIYESLVAQKITAASNRFGSDLRVFYPSVNIWSDYPYSILVGDSSTAEEKDAALAFMKYLYSVPVQQGALRAGFRPANPDVPLTSADPNNPFNKYRDAGLQINIPRASITDAPSGDVVTRLMSVFAR